MARHQAAAARAAVAQAALRQAALRQPVALRSTAASAVRPWAVRASRPGSRHAWAWWRQTEPGCPPIDLDEVLATFFIAVGHCLVCQSSLTVELEIYQELENGNVAT